MLSEAEAEVSYQSFAISRSNYQQPIEIRQAILPKNPDRVPQSHPDRVL
jgi:hypothetical protein